MVLLPLCGLLAADWPQWRGPNRDGVASGSAPASWPEQLHRKWSLTVGEGHSSPVLADGRLFVLSREGENEIVRAVDPATGKVVWHQSYPAPFKVSYAAASHGPGPKSTPTYHAGKLFTFGIGGILSCFDAASGRVLWRQDFKNRFQPTWPDYGVAVSPIVDGTSLIVHVGGGEGAITAFDTATGTTKWQWTGDGPAYASPVIAEIGGVRQLVTQTRLNIVGLSTSTGELLWKIGYRTAWDQNAVTPIAYHQTLILSGLDNGIMGLRAIKDAKGWRTERLWDNTQAPMYMSTPVLAGDLLFGFTSRNKGQFVCLDPRTGRTLWTGPPRQGDNAAIVRLNDLLFLLKDDAELLIARVSAKNFDVLRRYTVAGSPTWAHPVVLDSGVVVKDKTSLILWTWK